MGEAVVKALYDGRLITGRGASTDIFVASAKAFLDVINRVVWYEDMREKNGQPRTIAPGTSDGVGLAPPNLPFGRSEAPRSGRVPRVASAARSVVRRRARFRTARRPLRGS